MGWLSGKAEDVKVQAECKKGDGWKSGQKNSGEAVEDAMKHSEEEHGNRFLGMKWS